MPLTAKGNKIMSAMRSQYGEKKGTSVFYASRNKGTIKGVDPESSRPSKDAMKTVVSGYSAHVKKKRGMK
jgi:hypothetical protein